MSFSIPHRYSCTSLCDRASQGRVCLCLNLSGRVAPDATFLAAHSPSLSSPFCRSSTSLVVLNEMYVTVPLSSVARVPWKNGGGTTRELFALPFTVAQRAVTRRLPAAEATPLVAAEDPGWCLRLSAADVSADGPFSCFPGVERWLAILRGGGVELSFPSAELLAEKGRCCVQVRQNGPLFSFDGGVPPTSRLLQGGEQPTLRVLDFNVMHRAVSERRLDVAASTRVRVRQLWSRRPLPCKGAGEEALGPRVQQADSSTIAADDCYLNEEDGAWCTGSLTDTVGGLPLLTAVLTTGGLPLVVQKGAPGTNADSTLSPSSPDEEGIILHVCQAHSDPQQQGLQAAFADNAFGVAFRLSLAKDPLLPNAKRVIDLPPICAAYIIDMWVEVSCSSGVA